MDKNFYDILIVGAGPTGSTLGFLTSSLGMKVLVVEQQVFPRPKMCGGLLTWKTRQLVERLFGISFRKQFSVENISFHFSLYEHFEKKNISV